MADDIQPDLFQDKPAAPPPVDRPEAAPEPKPEKFESVRDALNSAVEEVRARDEKGRFTKSEESPKPPIVEKDTKPAPAQAVEQLHSEPATAEPKTAPQSWSKEAKTLWDSLPPSIQAEVHRREADTTKGVQQLRSRYDALDKALAPHRQVIQQSGRTEADVVQQLIGWAYALAGPQKLQAFQHLARTYGVDPNTLGSATAPQGGNSQSAIHPEVAQRLNYLTSVAQQQQQYVQSAQAAAAEQHVMAWAKDKPHYQAVRETMAQYINADLYALQQGQAPVGGFVKDGNIDLDAAYSAAVYANPETRAAAIQEEQAKKAAANKAAVEKARSAAVSVRTGTPSAPASTNGKAPKNQSVRDAIKDAWQQHRSR